MDWLYQRYWLLQVQPTFDSFDDEGKESVLNQKQKLEILSVLIRYKAIQKQVIRDASSSNGRELQKIERVIQRWIVDVGMDRIGLMNNGSSRAGDSKAAEEAERAGLQALAEVLTENLGVLVPTSKR